MALRLAAAVTFATLLGAICLSQEMNVHEKALSLAVMIQTFSNQEGPPKYQGYGAGIVVGLTNKSVYIVTAGHVVIGDSGETNRPVVHFCYRCDASELRSLRDHLNQRTGGVTGDVVCNLWPTDRSKDLALIKVPFDTSNYRFERQVIGSLDPVDLKSGTDLFATGFAEGVRPWFHAAAGDRLSAIVLDEREIEPDHLEIEQDHLVLGLSGGPVFDDSWNLIGLVTKEDTPYIKIALTIESVRKLLQKDCAPTLGGEGVPWLLSQAPGRPAIVELVEQFAGALKSANHDEILQLFPATPAVDQVVRDGQNRLKHWRTDLGVSCPSRFVQRSAQQATLDCEFRWSLCGKDAIYSNANYVTYERFDLRHSVGVWQIEAWQRSPLAKAVATSLQDDRGGPPSFSECSQPARERSNP